MEIAACPRGCWDWVFLCVCVCVCVDGFGGGDLVAAVSDTGTSNAANMLSGKSLFCKIWTTG